MDIYLRQNGDTSKPLHDQLHWTAPSMTKIRQLNRQSRVKIAAAGAFSDGRTVALIIAMVINGPHIHSRFSAKNEKLRLTAE